MNKAKTIAINKTIFDLYFIQYVCWFQFDLSIVSQMRRAEQSWTLKVQNAIALD